MPLFFTTLHWLIFCGSLLGIITFVHGEEVSYGMRIKPIKRVVPILQTSTYCPTCNKTASLRTKTEKEAQISTNKFKNSVNPLVKIQQTASPFYSAFPSYNSSRETTFFFTHLEPHRFEYRAMFNHHPNSFQPFVHDFEPFSREYPPLPKFPSFSDFSNFFQNNNDPFPKLPDFTFPTLSPEIKRVWNPVPEVQQQPKSIMGELPETLDNPLIKNYDIVLGHVNYPKIFRFNEERMNIEDFDRQKKIKYYNMAKHGQNNLIETENVKREHLLILHGGIFTVKEPPVYNKHAKKRRKLGPFGRHILKI